MQNWCSDAAIYSFRADLFTARRMAFQRETKSLCDHDSNGFESTPLSRPSLEMALLFLRSGSLPDGRLAGIPKS